jgi:hypothetical protein
VVADNPSEPLVERASRVAPASTDTLKRHPPCPLHRPSISTARPRRPRPRGLARLEFALTVLVCSLVAAFSLGAVSRMQSLGRDAQRLTQDAQQASASAVSRVRCELAQAGRGNPADCNPCPISNATMPEPGTAASTSNPPRSCPSIPPEGVSP